MVLPQALRRALDQLTFSPCSDQEFLEFDVMTLVGQVHQMVKVLCCCRGEVIYDVIIL